MDTSTRESPGNDSDEDGGLSALSRLPLPRRLSMSTNIDSLGPRFLETMAREAEAGKAEEFRLEAARIEASHRGTAPPPLSDVPRHMPSSALHTLDPSGGHSEEVWHEDSLIKRHLHRISASRRRIPRPEPVNRMSVIHEDAFDFEDHAAGSSTAHDAEGLLKEIKSMNLSSASLPPGFSISTIGPLTRRIIQQEVRLGYRRDENDFAYFEQVVKPILPTDLILVCSTTEGDVSTGIIFNHRGKLYTALGEHFDIREIALPKKEEEIIGILKEHKLPDARKQGLIVLAPVELTAMFEDIRRQRWVAVENLHNWAIWKGDGWVQQTCECDYCVRKAAKAIAGPSQ